MRLITPWNFPLLQTSWKIAPALAAGCTFVLKPAELTPSTAIWLVGALEELGLPAGVANLVLGAGSRVGDVLTESPDVDLVSFTGGVVTGRRVMASAAGTVKKVALELGGKNPNIIFADADLDAALDMATTAIFLDSGQVCSAGARLIVEESIHDEFVEKLVAATRLIIPGGPFDPAAHTGALISAEHLAKVEEYVAGGIAEGERAPRSQFRRQTPADDLGAATLDDLRQGGSFGPVLTIETFSGATAREAETTQCDIVTTPFTVSPVPCGRRTLAALNGWPRAFAWNHLDQRLPPYVPQAEWAGSNKAVSTDSFDRSRRIPRAKHVWHNIRQKHRAGSLRASVPRRRRQGQIRRNETVRLRHRRWKVSRFVLANRVCADPSTSMLVLKPALRLRVDPFIHMPAALRSRSAANSPSGTNRARTHGRTPRLPPAGRCSAARPRSTE